MNYYSVIRFFLTLCASLAGATVLSGATLEITEFMADNRETTVDEDGDRSDWIEIHNTTGAEVDMSGWFLTDTTNDLTQWSFPAITIPADGYRVVFASGKDRRQPGRPMHTNFRLDREGEYLALLDPDTNIVSEFQFPPQQADIAYGPADTPGTEVTLLDTGAQARALIPNDDSIDSTWFKQDFDDSTWKTGATGVGYDYGNLIGLDIGEMRYVNESAFIRIPFDLEQIPNLDRLILHLQYDDGMVAYLNGTEIARHNAPQSLAWNSGAPENRPDSIATEFAEFVVTDSISLLSQGKNILAFHGLNNDPDSSDLLIRPRLSGYVLPPGVSKNGYLFKPTPGESNTGETSHGSAGAVVFSQKSGTFRNSLTIQLEPPTGAPKSAEIRYTTDGTRPSASSTLYQDPITITQTTLLRARVVLPDGGLGIVQSKAYVALEPEISRFSSNLPLVILENFGQGDIPHNDYQSAFLTIMDAPDDSRSSITNSPQLTTRAGIKIRGSSTAWRPKPSLNVEAWNEFDEDKNIEPLGMPNESDWILWGPYNFDRALMRNPLIYELSNQMGRYAVRTRFVEVFLSTGGTSISNDQYWGVYALMEKVKRDDDRVDVDKLFTDNDRKPWITGGYIFKIDRLDPGDTGFNAAGQTICYVDPKEIEIEQPIREPQEQYVNDYFNQFGQALNSPDFDDPETGYAKYIDVDAAIDHHLINVLAFNVDALRLSTYIHKQRGGKLEFGPIWDFDRSMGSTDGRDDNPYVWRAETGDRGTDFFNYIWWGKMFTDIDFFQKYIDRWQELRKGTFSENNIHSLINSMALELLEAQERDLDRWGQTPRFGGFRGEVIHLKDWFSQRIDFIDSQFVAPPMLDPAGGVIQPGTELTIHAPNNSTVYYTLDGTDPRLPGGGVSPSAKVYSEPISFTSKTRVTTRVFDPGHQSLTGPNNPPLSSKWSGPATALFSEFPPASAAALIVSELYYNPAAPTADESSAIPGVDNDDFEFIELKNISDSTLDLSGVRFVNGIAFNFAGSQVTTLAPNGCVVVVKSLDAFQTRYQNVERIAGEYTGNLANDGEYLRLIDANGEDILAFEYHDDWFPGTDGAGFSLIVADESAGPDAWSRRDGWLSSGISGGTPGTQNTTPTDIPRVLVNEILTHTTPPATDTIELYNPNDKPVDIGGWFLTDDIQTPHKFRIPDQTVIRSNAFMVFDEDDFNSSPDSSECFALNAQGEEIYLFSADTASNLTGYIHGFNFSAAPEAATIGRHVVSTGNEHFIIQSEPTLGAHNSGPRIGPVVINEIMYEPPLLDGTNNLRDEFIELRNITKTNVPLFNPQEPWNTWRLSNGIEFGFPTNTTVPSDGLLVVVGFNPDTDTESADAFRAQYQLDDHTKLVGPFNGRLNNAGDQIVLLRPDTPQPDGDVPCIPVDHVTYSPNTPWPTNSNGTGYSIQRINDACYGDDPINWTGAHATPGSTNNTPAVPDHDSDGLPDAWELEFGFDPFSATGDNGADADPDGDGLSNLDEFTCGTVPVDPNSVFRLKSISIKNNETLLRFRAIPGRIYRIIYSADINTGEWNVLTNIPAPETTQDITITDPSPQQTRFYRLVIP